MENSELLSIIDNESRPAKTKSKKRKWREIEAIQERYRLKRELSYFEVDLEYELEHLA